MGLASRRTVLLRASALADLEGDALAICDDDLDELQRIALLVVVSGGGLIDEIPDEELSEILGNVLGQEDLDLLDRVSTSL